MKAQVPQEIEVDASKTAAIMRWFGADFDQALNLKAI